MSAARLILALLIPTAAAAQEGEPPRDPFWAGLLTHTQEWLTRSGHERSTTRLRLGYRVGRGSVALDVARVEDFGGVGTVYGAETYLPLWYHAEGYVRVASAPEALSVPDLLAGGEVLQHLGGGWSAGAGGWYRDYDVESLHQLHLTAGRRWPLWQLRARAGILRSGGRTLPLGHVIVRRFIGAAGSYAEAVLAAREEVLDFLPREEGGTRILTAPTLQGVLRGQIALDRDDLSILLAAGSSEMEGHGQRVVAEVGLAARW